MNGWAVIVNLKSGKRNFKDQMDYLKSRLDRHSFKYELRITEFAGHATLIARHLILEGCRKILIVGGDGTVNEVINGVIVQDSIPPDLIIGLIPRGTGNDWGRYWGLTRNYRHSVDQFFSGKLHTIDIGRVTYDLEGEKEFKYFINSVGFGLDAEVAHQAEHLKKYLGSHSFLYLLALLKLVFTFKAHPIRLSSGERSFNDYLFTMNIANACYSGGGMKQNPDARPDDGILDVMLVRKPSMKDILSALPLIFNGKLLQHPAIESFRTNKLILDCDHGGSLFETDGVVVHCNPPMEISLMASAVQMIVPK